MRHLGAAVNDAKWRPLILNFALQLYVNPMAFAGSNPGEG